MLSIMGISEKIGFLQIGGKAITVEQIAIMAGVSVADAQRYTDELEANAVFSRDDNGVIFNRRMVRETKRYNEAREAGLKGGNPILLESDTRSQNLEATEGLRVGVKGRDKGQVDISAFDTFWKAYPKKVSKANAVKAFPKAIKKVDFDVMLKALEAHKKQDQWTKDKGKYIPNPASWLNFERWEDVLANSAKPLPTAINASNYEEVRKTLND